MDGLRHLPKPDVVLYGSAAQARGGLHLDLVELRDSESHYIFVTSFPEAEFLPGGGHGVACAVSSNGHVRLYGSTSSGAILENPTMVHNRRRIQLCPDDPWGISFVLPGRIDARTTEVLRRLPTSVEVRVRKSN